MRVKTSATLLSDNFGCVYKLLVYRVVINVIITALCVALLQPIIDAIFTSNQFKVLLSDGGAFISKLLTEGIAEAREARQTFVNSLSQFGAFIKSVSSERVWSFVLLVFMVILSRLLVTVGNFGVGELLEKRMSSYARLSFTHSLIRNLGKALLYAIVYVPITVIYDALFFCLAGLLAWAVISMSFAVLGVAAFIGVIMLSVALKLTVLYSLIPALVTDNLSLGGAFKKCFSLTPKQFGQTFSSYLVTVLMVEIINVVAAIATFGAALLITVPATFVYLICMQFVNYYTVNNKKFFITFDKIVVQKSEEYKTEFYDRVDE